MKLPIPLAVALLLASFASDGVAVATPDYAAQRAAILAHPAAAARKTDPAFKGFSVAAGRTFFLAHPPGARPATPACSYCHTTDPRNRGRARAG